MEERAALADQAMISAAEGVLRAGGSVAFDDDPDRALFAAIDAVGIAAWTGWCFPAKRQAIILTGQRARAIGLPVAGDVNVALPREQNDDLEVIAGRRAGRCSVPGRRARVASRAANAIIALAKRAGLLPALVQCRTGAEPHAPTLRLPRVGMVVELGTPPMLDIDIQVRLTIPSANTARLHAFRSATSPAEHLALTIGELDQVEAPLCRVHSECLTGDVLGSLRCDCGEQLQAAIARMGAAGAGILLYLRQEGRGIGLVNKLRAYELQEHGLDTMDANTHLGFGADERDHAVAAAMLRRLGVQRIRLLTNNPEKVRTLRRHGITIAECVPLCIAANEHNRDYLMTKALRTGHRLGATTPLLTPVVQLEA